MSMPTFCWMAQLTAPGPMRNPLPVGFFSMARTFAPSLAAAKVAVIPACPNPHTNISVFNSSANSKLPSSAGCPYHGSSDAPTAFAAVAAAPSLDAGAHPNIPAVAKPAPSAVTPERNARRETPCEFFFSIPFLLAIGLDSIAAVQAMALLKGDGGILGKIWRKRIPRKS